MITQEDYETSYYKVKSEMKVKRKITQVDYETSFFKLKITMEVKIKEIT